VSRRRGVTAAIAGVLAVATLAGATLTAACASRPPSAAADTTTTAVDSALLRRLLDAHPGLRPVLARAAHHRVQVVLGLVEPGPDGRPRLVQHGYRAGEEYLYPASTVKLLAAVAALEWLAELRASTGQPLDVDTPLLFHPLFAGEQREERDESNLDGGRITVRHEIRKLFLVSDNEAFNRLYELVGPARLARTVERAGLAGVRVVHRLSEPRSAAENLRLPRIDLVGDGWVHMLPERSDPPPPPPGPLRGLRLGRAHFAGDELVPGPMDFAGKNRAPLATLQRALCMALRPDVDCGGPGFALGEEERALLRAAMVELPAESANPRYDPAAHPAESVEFLLPGLRRVVPDAALRVYGKSGQAYGFTLDNAWVVDERTGRGFFLAAALYTNEDGVLNDDAYDYEQVALPFLADLAEAVARGRR
jgi:hypothetical protein